MPELAARLNDQGRTPQDLIDLVHRTKLELENTIRESAGLPIVVLTRGYKSSKDIYGALGGILTGDIDTNFDPSNPATFAREVRFRPITGMVVAGVTDLIQYEPSIAANTGSILRSGEALSHYARLNWLNIASFTQDYRLSVASEEGLSIVEKIEREDVLIGRDIIAASPHFNEGISQIMSKLVDV